MTDASQQTTYLSSDATYNANEQMTDYDFEVNAGQSSFSEAYDLAYDSLGRLSTMETDSTSRTVTHGYDANNGQLTSLQFSDLGTYTIDYLGNGNIDTITYPNSQGEETYTYGEGKGRLSQIEYPNNDTLEFQWNDKDEITRIDYTVYATQIETRYTMTYTPNHQVATLTQSIDSVQQYVWTFTWAPNGLEKAVMSINGQPVLTQDFTTDPQGRILSMTYDTAGETGYDGELYFHYDHFGNTTLLTDEEGDPVASFEYDLHSGKIVNEWNPEGLEVRNLGGGKKDTISIILESNIIVMLMQNTIVKVVNQQFSISFSDKIVFIPAGFIDGNLYLGIGNDGYCSCIPNLANCNDIDTSTGGWNDDRTVYQERTSFRKEFTDLHRDLDKLNCDELLSAYMDAYTNSQYFGYLGNYKSFHPFDDDEWREEISEKRLDRRDSDQMRNAIARLQMIDCYMKTKNCPPFN